MKKKLAVGSLILASALLLSACSYKTSSSNQGQAQSSSSPTVSEAGSVLITYSDQGFSPAEAKAKIGQQIEFKNTSNENIQVNSAPHPAHNLFPELNIGAIAAGESKSVTFTKTGTYKYHNHLDVSQFGSIEVE